MRRIRKAATAIALSLTLALVAPIAVPSMGTTTIVQGATIKLNKKIAAITAGKTLQLKLTGTKAAVKWTTSSKTVATVDQKGKVTGKKAGKAVITATANKKKYTCTVTVKAKAKENIVTFEDISFELPDSWATKTTEGIPIIGCYSKTGTPETAKTFVNITVLPSASQIDYGTLSEMYIDVLISNASKQGVEITKEDIKTTEIKSGLGVVIKVEVTATLGDQATVNTIYAVSTDEKLIEITGIDTTTTADPSGVQVAENIFKTLTILN